MSIIYSIASSNVFARLSGEKDLLPTDQLKDPSNPKNVNNLRATKNDSADQDSADKLSDAAKAKDLLAPRNLISLREIIGKLTNNPLAKKTPQLLPTTQKTEISEVNNGPKSELLKSLNGFIEGAESKLDKIAQDVQGIINLFRIDQ